MSWAMTVRSIRREGGMTQGDLAGVIGVDQGTVSRWERGGVAPSESKKQAILDKVRAHCPKACALAKTVEHIMADPKQLILTHPGTFSPLLMSTGYSRYLAAHGADEGTVYNYTVQGRMTDQMHTLFTHVPKMIDLFSDPTIHEIETSNRVMLPNGTVYRDRSQIIPTRFTDGAPRLLTRKIAHDDDDNGPGTVTVRRLTGRDEFLTF